MGVKMYFCLFVFYGFSFFSISLFNYKINSWTYIHTYFVIIIVIHFHFHALVHFIVLSIHHSRSEIIEKFLKSWLSGWCETWTYFLCVILCHHHYYLVNIPVTTLWNSLIFFTFLHNLWKKKISSSYAQLLISTFFSSFLLSFFGNFSCLLQKNFFLHHLNSHCRGAIVL